MDFSRQYHLVRVRLVKTKIVRDICGITQGNTAFLEICPTINSPFVAMTSHGVLSIHFITYCPASENNICHEMQCHHVPLEHCFNGFDARRLLMFAEQ